MKILYSGSLLGNESLCDDGRNIVKELSKYNKIKLDMPKVEGYWEQFYDTFEGKEDIYLKNGHHSTLPEIAKNHKNIVAVSSFETIYPKLWVDCLNIPEVKLILTISKFNKEMLIQSGVKKPIKVIYLGLDKRFFKLGVNMFPKDKSFKFLNVSAPHGIGKKDRKGLDVLISAFKKEFGDSPDFTLILKINTIYTEIFNRKLGRDFNIYDYIRQFIPKGMTANNISVMLRYLNHEQLNLLYNSVDCGVYPFRGEGFGKPIAEMMKLGKPVICTDYSAPREFTPVSNRIKVDRMTKLDYSISPYYDSRFAEPSEDDLRKKMRYIYENYDKEKTVFEDYLQSKLKLHPELNGFDWVKVGRVVHEELVKLTDYEGFNKK